MSKIAPLKIKVIEGKYLFIQWNDNSHSEIKLSALRRECPCAICAAERDNMGKSYFPIFSGDGLKIADISLMGYYAMSIKWKDGHSTGMYEFSKLRSMNLVTDGSA